MALFDPAFRRTLTFEGITLENVPNDDGGLTFCGIARNKQPNWAGWAIVDRYINSSPDLITAAQLATDDANLMVLMEQFYISQIWNHNCLGQLDQEIANQLYDAITNCGETAVTWIQFIVGVTADAILGPETADAINNFVDPARLVQSYLDARKAYYNSLAESNPEKFGPDLEGWLSRCVLSC